MQRAKTGAVGGGGTSHRSTGHGACAAGLAWAAPALVLAFGAVFVGIGCGSSGGAAAGDGSPGGNDDGATGDGFNQADVADDQGDGLVGSDRPTKIPPVAPQSTPTALSPKWLVTTTASATPRNQVEGGSFVMPQAGTSGGFTWSEVTPGSGGQLGNAPQPNGFLYGATQIDLAAKTYLYGRFDNAYLAYGNGAPQPGDVYGRRNTLVPLASAPGSNLVFVVGWGRIDGTAAAHLWTTSDEVVFNLDATTTPELVAGEQLEQWIGIPVLNVSSRAAFDVVARVVESDTFQATEVRYPTLTAWSATQLGFQLLPKAPIAGAGLTVTVRVESPWLEASYERSVTINTVAAGAKHRRTFRSEIDGSVQYFVVIPPAAYDPAKSYGLVLTLHPAGSEATSMAAQYAPKDWTWIVAPTNRKPYGFDWESFGRRDALEALAVATKAFKPSPDRIYLTGHSMGGHGTWNIGVLFPGRFAALGPSAGWISRMSYQGYNLPGGALGRAQASMDTLAYLSNLKRRGAFILHAELDPNVPSSESRTMVEALKPITSDVVYYERPGETNHWWTAPNGNCADWPDLFTFLKAHTFDPTELDFAFTTPSPAVSPAHSYATILSQKDALHDSVLTSSYQGDTVTLATTNVRSLRLDGAALRAKGILHLIVDGAAALDVPDGPLAWGPQDGKRPGLHGPLSAAFERPFCFVYPEGSDFDAVVFQRHAAFLLTYWSIYGNGHACAVPESELTPELRAARNIIYVGIPPDRIANLPKRFGWGSTKVTVGDGTYTIGALALVFPDGQGLSAAFGASSGYALQIYAVNPFAGAMAADVPDWTVWSRGAVIDSGFFAPDWTGP